MVALRQIRVLSLLLIATWPLFAPARTTNTEIYISTIEYPPLFQSAKIPGMGYGVASDLTQAAFEAVNINVKFVHLPMSRAVVSVSSQQYPANLGSINWFIKDGKEESVEVVNLFNIAFLLYYKKEKFPDGVHFKELSELKNLHIGNVRGSSTTPVVTQAGLNIHWFRTLEQNFRVLNAGRIDLAIGGESAGWTLIKSLYPDTHQQFATAENSIHQVPIGLVFHRSQQQLIEKFKLGIDVILQNGTYMDIAKRYYGNKALDEHFLTRNIHKRQKMLSEESESLTNK